MTHTSAPQVLSPAERWRLQEFGQTTATGDAADGENPDGDPYNNLMERALGLDPESPDSGSDLTLLIRSVGGQDYWHATVSRNPFAADLDFTIESSTDLSVWGTNDTVVVIDSGGTLLIRNDVAVGTEPKRFYQLKVTSP